MSNVANTYLREIDKQIVCPEYIKKSFMHQLKNEVYFFCEDHVDANTNSLQERFGTPEDVAQEFLLEAGHKTVNQYNAVRKRLLFIIIGILLPAIAFASFVGIKTQMIRQQLPNDDYVASVTYEDKSNGFTFFPIRGLIFGSSSNE